MLKKRLVFDEEIKPAEVNEKKKISKQKTRKKGKIIRLYGRIQGLFKPPRNRAVHRREENVVEEEVWFDHPDPFEDDKVSDISFPFEDDEVTNLSNPNVPNVPNAGVLEKRVVLDVPDVPNVRNVPNLPNVVVLKKRVVLDDLFEDNKVTSFSRFYGRIQGLFKPRRNRAVHHLEKNPFEDDKVIDLSIPDVPNVYVGDNEARVVLDDFEIDHCNVVPEFESNLENETIKKVEDVKTFLKKEAFRKTDISWPRYLDKIFDFVELQLSDEWKNSFSCKGLYPCGDISVKSLLFQNRNDNKSVTVICGSCGSGKSAVTSQVLQSLNNNILLHAKFVFYMQYADIDLDYESTLLEFLVPTLPYQWIVNKDVCEKVLEQITVNEKVCVIIDDLNLAELKFSDKVYTFLKDKSTATGETHLKNILYGKTLLGSTILVTLRPSQMSLLPAGIEPDSVVNILGLNKEGLEVITKQVSDQHSSSIVKYIEGYQNLCKFCLTPANCIAVSHIINTFNSCEKTNAPFTCLPLTKVFLPSVALMILDKNIIDDQCNLLCAAKCACKNFSQTSQIFDKLSDTDNHFCPIIDMFLQIRPPKYFCNKFDIGFYNICQDCFAAVYLLYGNQESDKGFNEYLEKFLRPQLVNESLTNREITKFLFGLCNEFVVEYIKQLLPSCTFPTKRSQKLDNFVIDILKTQKNHLFKSNSTLLFVSCLAFENQCDVFTEKLVNDAFPNEIIFNIYCSLNEIAAFIYVLQKRNTELSIRNINSLNEESKNLLLLADLPECVLSKLYLDYDY